MSCTVQIYIGLRNEGIDVWRPVLAERIGIGMYRVLKQEYDSSVESWQFEPGDEVFCEEVDTPKGSLLVATRLIGDSGEVG